MQGGSNTILVVLLTLLCVALGAGLLWARRQGRHAMARGLGAGALAIPLVYFVALLLTSLTSRERVLGLHEPVEFCGFYLDCHISVAVEQVERAETIGSSTAQGVFYIMTVRYGSDAIRATLTPGHPAATVMDGRGRTFPPSPTGEAALAAVEGTPIPLIRPLAPGESYRTRFVFDVPEDVVDPRLRLAPGTWVERLTELFLIGDDDSLLHRRTTVRLSGAAA